MDTVIESFLERVAELKSQYASHIASGTATDFANYQKLCGTLEGLAIAERELKDISSQTGEDLSGMSDLT